MCDSNERTESIASVSLFSGTFYESERLPASALFLSPFEQTLEWLKAHPAECNETMEAVVRIITCTFRHLLSFSPPLEAQRSID